MKPVLLDLYCGEGGAGTGYARAGFDVIGVDVAPQRRYPFRFVQADALAVLSDPGELDRLGIGPVDAIHASPPCQDHMRHRNRVHGTGWMLAATRSKLAATGLPWVLENVPGAAMRPDLKLCGCMFGLEITDHAGRLRHLVRERWFETSPPLFDLRAPCSHRGRHLSVAGHGEPSRSRLDGGRGVPLAGRRALMGCEWMSREGLAEAIPPAYTEYVGGLLLAALHREETRNGSGMHEPSVPG